MEHSINLTLKVWRQNGADDTGRFEVYEAKDVDTASSFLEMLDVVNEGLIAQGKEPIAFDHDCREGICGACGAMINGQAHGPLPGTTLCQTHMRSFEDGDTLVIEPWRSAGFRVVKDLVVDRSALDNIISAGGFVSVKTGCAPDAHVVPVKKDNAETAFEAAACIGCGACVAACPNGSAMLFTAAKVSHLNHLPQGEVEADRRSVAIVNMMDEQGFGNCSNAYACEGACPKEISVEHIARMNKDYRKGSLHAE